MSLTILFGTQSLAPVLALEVERIAGIDGALERWHVEMAIEGATAAAAEQATLQLEATLAGEGALKLQSAGSDIRTLDTGDCRSGPALAKARVVTRDPAAAHEQRRIALTFEALLQDNSIAVQSHTFTVSVAARAGEPATLTTRGRAILRRDEDPAAHEGLLPAIAAGYRRVRREITRDAAAPSLEYVVEDREVFAALPAGVDEGEYTLSTREQSGVRTEVIRGYFIGPAARVRAHEIGARFGPLAAERIDENVFLRRVDFEFTPARTASAGVAELTEHFTFTWKRLVVDHPVLGGGIGHYRQFVGAPFVEVTQRGEARGIDRTPNAPAPRYADDMLEHEVTHRDALTTTWRYLFRLLGAQATAYRE